MCCAGGMSFLPWGEKYAGSSLNVNFFDPKVKGKSFYDLTQRFTYSFKIPHDNFLLPTNTNVATY